MYELLILFALTILFWRTLTRFLAWFYDAQDRLWDWVMGTQLIGVTTASGNTWTGTAYRVKAGK